MAGNEYEIEAEILNDIAHELGPDAIARMGAVERAIILRASVAIARIEARAERLGDVLARAPEYSAEYVAEVRASLGHDGGGDGE